MLVNLCIIHSTAHFSWLITKKTLPTHLRKKSYKSVTLRLVMSSLITVEFECNTACKII